MLLPWLQCKKLAEDAEDEDYVTEEDEGSESDKSRKNNKRVSPEELGN